MLTRLTDKSIETKVKDLGEILIKMDTFDIPSCSKKMPFTPSERALLVALVRERPIIENKRTNAKNIEKKKLAWEELAQNYNSQPLVSQRNTQQLKRCWENIKTLRKRELSAETRSLSQTGEYITDEIRPFLNLKVPDLIDSNYAESPDDCNIDKINYVDNIKKRKFSKEVTEIFDDEIDKGSSNENVSYGITPIQKLNNKLHTDTDQKIILAETDIRIQRCKINIEQDKILHDIQIEREKILLDRERNLLNYEKTMHNLQIEKLNTEIDLLKRMSNNKYIT